MTAEIAEVAASHALLLLAAATLACAIAAAFVLGLAALASRHADRLWALVDLVVPGQGLRARTYLLVHLGLGLVAMLAIVAFVAIARDVSASGALASFDLAFSRALQRQVSPTWRAAFWWFTWLGAYLPITLVVAAGAWRLFSRGRRLLAWMWVISQVGGGVLNETLKEVFARPRPDGADRILFGDSWSFPSGHAMGTFVLCGVAAYILMRTIRSWTARTLLVAGALAWSLAMGFSRIYLGVHYVSDVAAGFLVGAAWVAVCVSGAEVAAGGKSEVRSQKSEVGSRK